MISVILTLSSFSDVIAELVGLALLVGDVVLTQPLNGIGVLHATERTGRRLEVRVELLDVGSNLRLSKSEVNDVADDILDVVEEISEGNEIQLGFDVSVLGQVTTSERLLGTERRAHTVHVTKRGDTGLQVEL